MKDKFLNLCRKADPWNIPGFDPYPFMRPFLFLLDPEFAHAMTIRLLGFNLGPRTVDEDDPVLRTRLFGLDFSNPIGLAAGLDKQAEVIDQFMRFGFSHIETGTVVLRPQPGNPKPRMFRVPTAKALINRFGWNSVGAEVFAENLKAYRAKKTNLPRPVGVNIGFNKDSKDPTADYIGSLVKVAPFVDYVVISVSSPNTPGARDLQKREPLSRLLSDLLAARKTHAPRLPILLKIAFDLTEEQQEDIAVVVLKSGIQGLIVGNTSPIRPSNIPREIAMEQGGLSGPPVFRQSTQVLSNMYKLTKGKIPLIANCGVSTGEDAYLKIRAGASLVQIFTVLVYDGPLAVRRIKRELAGLLHSHGFKSVAEAVGADHKQV